MERMRPSWMGGAGILACCLGAGSVGARESEDASDDELEEVIVTGYRDQQANNREFDFDLLPAEIFSKRQVSKTPCASMVEGGSSGTVDLRPTTIVTTMWNAVAPTR